MRPRYGSVLRLLAAVFVVAAADGLIEGAFAGLIEVVDPFYELWTQSVFDPDLLTGDP